MATRSKLRAQQRLLFKYPVFGDINPAEGNTITNHSSDRFTIRVNDRKERDLNKTMKDNMLEYDALVVVAICEAYIRDNSVIKLASILLWRILEDYLSSITDVSENPLQLARLFIVPAISEAMFRLPLDIPTQRSSLASLEYLLRPQDKIEEIFSKLLFQVVLDVATNFPEAT
ncbi:unnamed protein product [Sphagnum tenellum]